MTPPHLLLSPKFYHFVLLPLANLIWLMRGQDDIFQTGKSQLLANQHYNACIRTERFLKHDSQHDVESIIVIIIIITTPASRTYCSICYWTPTTTTGFHMSVPNGQVPSIIIMVVIVAVMKKIEEIGKKLDDDET